MSELESLIRVDKNFAFNIQEFRVFEEDSKLLKALIIYMAWNNQKDLFGFYKIDPANFAKIMFFNKNHLFQIHPNPKQLQLKNAVDLLAKESLHGRMTEFRTWSSYLENALFILNNEKIIKDYRYKTDKKAISSIKSFTFLDEIQFEIVKTGKTKKIIYKYIPNEKFQENLKNYFLNTKLNKYNVLKKPNLDEAYLDILNRINNCNAKNENSITFNLDNFASILGIGKYKSFSKYKLKISSKFELLKKTIGSDVKDLELIWGKRKGHAQSLVSKLSANSKRTTTASSVNYDNIPIITWRAESKDELRIKDSETFKNIFDTELIKELTKAYFWSNNTEIDELDEFNKKKSFYAWFFSEKDMDVKSIKFQDTYVDVYKSTDGLAFQENKFNETIKRLIKIKSEVPNFITLTSNGLLHLKFPNGDSKKFEHLYEVINIFSEN